ncbi:ABC transporter [Bacillus sp. FJAT-18017]|uniref:ABC transporter permease subunit n=1 Tax=Bacillus sp. FJAT-18017 TaxID=1705566 RepID=UPI0006AEF836|nr:ABC transporter permease subunit [Bacillus sp. FJAT-18017]ALC92185.1 ABC transporter [Bacillus sp. FJAT-18017]
MNIFARELKAHLKSLVFWSIGIVFMVISGMGKFSYYEGSGEAVNELISQIPKTLRTVLGFGDFDLTKASGFYGVLFLYLVIMATIHAVMLGANIISKEERDKTTEFLMVKPVSRSRIITFKLLAAIVNVVILNLVTLVSSMAIVNSYASGEEVSSEIGLLIAGLFILQVMFLVIGTGIAALCKNPKSAASLATTILLGAFILSVIVDMNENLEGLKYITPFKYFDAAQMLNGTGFDAVYVLLSVIIISIMVWVTYIFYRKRDLQV